MFVIPLRGIVNGQLVALAVLHRLFPLTRQPAPHGTRNEDRRRKEPFKLWCPFGKPARLNFVRSISPNRFACPPDHTEAAGNRKGPAADEERSHTRQLRQSDGLAPGLDSTHIAYENDRYLGGDVPQFASGCLKFLQIS
jgi:hypothetical protein